MPRRERRTSASSLSRRSAQINQAAAILLLCVVLAVVLLFKDSIAAGLSNIFQASSADLNQSAPTQPSTNP